MKRIMIVDDSSAIRKFVKFALKVKGYIVIDAVDGLDALEKLKDNFIDLLVTDLNMPNMDGFELIATVRESNEYRELPIIVLTSEDKKREKDIAIEKGANEYLVKPFKPDEILKLVKKYID